MITIPPIEIVNASRTQPQHSPKSIIITSFVQNSQPSLNFQIKLTENFISIKSVLPNNQNQQKVILLDENLTYRINILKQSSSQNQAWFLHLQTNSTKYIFCSQQMDSAQVWELQLNKRLYKFGFLNDFRPVRRISKGFSSAVYQVCRKLDNKKYAAKVFPKTILDSYPDIKKAVHNEIAMLRKIKLLNHKNLLGLQEAYFSDSSLYLIIQLCGKDLFYGLKRFKGVYPEYDLKKIMKQLLDGLVTLHNQNIIHRDIKPGNILFRLNDQFQLVITDFGLTTSLGQEHPFSRCGTAGFIAPQIFILDQKSKPDNCASDIFSMGAVFHLLLTGCPLFEGQQSKQVFDKNKNMQFDLAHQKYRKINKNALNLLEKMLDKCQNRRITARQALDHQYFLDKAQSPVFTFQTAENFIIEDQQQFSMIDVGMIGNKKIKGQYRKASHR